MSFSVEYVDVTGDPDRRDRLIGQFTYLVPLTASTSVPLTLTYANHGQFLGDQDERLSAHLGLSYKISRDR